MTLLQWIGTKFNEGLEKVLPFIEKGAEIGNDFLPALQILIPEAAPILKGIQVAAALIEQKFAAAGAQSGTGDQKLASLIAAFGPTLSQFLASKNLKSDSEAVKLILQSVVASLNSVPAPA